MNQNVLQWTICIRRNSRFWGWIIWVFHWKRIENYNEHVLHIINYNMITFLKTEIKTAGRLEL